MKWTHVGAVAVSLLSVIACEDAQNGGGVTPVPDSGLLDAGGGGDADPIIDCPAPTAGPTMHQGTVKDETFTAAGSPHILPYDTSVVGTLTIEPCAVVQLAAGSTVTVAAGNKIEAKGLPTKPITITSKDPKPFSNIRAMNGGTLSLSYVNIDKGGDPLNSGLDYIGVLQATGAVNGPSEPTIFVDHVKITGSASNGIYLHDAGGFAPGSQALTITGSSRYPISTWSRAIDGIPTGAYTGNGRDQILMLGTGLAEGIHENATMHDRGVPYRLGGEATGGTLYVTSGTSTLATLTIEPGVVMKMKKGAVIYVDSATGDAPASGALIANGIGKPIVFTSNEAVPAAGDWLGIWFGQVPSSTNKIDNAVVEFAGGASSSGGSACNVPPTGLVNDGAIRIFGPPGAEFVTYTTIKDSAANGIDRAWRADDTTDFLTGNTFTNIGRCKQTYPKDHNGVCPDPVPCPQ